LALLNNFAAIMMGIGAWHMPPFLFTFIAIYPAPKRLFPKKLRFVCLIAFILLAFLQRSTAKKKGHENREGCFRGEDIRPCIKRPV